jgi:hypothetical protein
MSGLVVGSLEWQRGVVHGGLLRIESSECPLIRRLALGRSVQVLYLQRWLNFKETPYVLARNSINAIQSFFWHPFPNQEMQSLGLCTNHPLFPKSYLLSELIKKRHFSSQKTLCLLCFIRLAYFCSLALLHSLPNAYVNDGDAGRMCTSTSKRV